MNDQLTEFQERFCREYIKTGNASAAYRAVSVKSLAWKDETVWRAAVRIMAVSKVGTRIAELQARLTEKAIVTVESLAKELDAAAELAREIKQPGVVVSAVQVKARMYGLIIDKKEIRTGALDNLDVDDLKELKDAVSEYGVRRAGEQARPEGDRKTTH